VTFAGFGSFGVSERKVRLGCNLQTDAEIKIPAKKSVNFSAGKAFKESVQGPVSSDLERRSGAMFNRKGQAILPSPGMTDCHIKALMTASKALVSPLLDSASHTD
jgi:hypothetical protein